MTPRRLCSLTEEIESWYTYERKYPQLGDHLIIIECIRISTFTIVIVSCSIFLFSVLFSFCMWSWCSLFLLAAGLISSEKKMWPMNVFVIFHLKHIHVICEPFVINRVRGKPSNCYNVCPPKNTAEMLGLNKQCHNI